ncbi:MAG: dihydropteroate synthase [Clostridia bacterium]|nr:dihydropteroate synthase [Clostridia bacterium]
MPKTIDFTQFIVFDGGMGTLLQTQGLSAGELPESYNLLHPEIIENIHREYIEAGAQIITTNTFGANRYKLQGSGYKLEEIIKSGVEIAKRVAQEQWVALDIGPLGQLMEPLGNLSFQAAYEAFQEQVLLGQEAGADLILIETMSDVYELKAAILAAKENSNLPIICTMTFQEDGRTLTGTDPLTMVNIIQGLGVNALGINCSLGPKEILPLAKEILTYSQIPVIVQPNAGLPKEIKGQTIFDVDPVEFAKYIKEMAQLGVTIFGGCCGTTPQHIRALTEALKDLKPVVRQIKKITAVSSATKTVVLGTGVTIIGERINPTGKKRLREALKNNDLEYILLEGVEQRKRGAQILDVNVGLPEIDEEQVMLKVMTELQSIINLPLQIDSVRKDVLETAARFYNGKPLINSVNGKEEVMAEIFPIVKKYGCAVIALTLDEEGIPPKAEDRLKIAQKIVKRAEEYGIKKEDIIIDCLVLTASAQQMEVQETIKALSIVKKELGVKTTLGVSNVSFGLPNRGLLNRTFLTLALGAGLDAPILNPLDKEIMDTIKAYNVLWAYDLNGAEFIENSKTDEKIITSNSQSSDLDLAEIILEGIKGEAEAKTKALLEELTPLEIVDTILIPSLDQVGSRYEKGEIFLPQLIQSAETVKKAFTVLKEHLLEKKESNLPLQREKIILATVRGDIHDIGKNIVKILLENYGYEVIDLGKDVPEEVIVERAKADNVQLIGLSALMTTTVRNMETTIQALAKEKLPVKVIVGGAVLNPEYAQMVGADFYAPDAQEAVKIAQNFFRDRS